MIGDVHNLLYHRLRSADRFLQHFATGRKKCLQRRRCTTAGRIIMSEFRTAIKLGYGACGMAAHVDERTADRDMCRIHIDIDLHGCEASAEALGPMPSRLIFSRTRVSIAA
jgi:hypothetical protein